MIDKMEAALAFTKREEGEYSNDRRDSGNWTSGVCYQGVLIGSIWGIGAPCLVAYNARQQLGLPMTATTMQQLDPTLYEDIATDEYWSLMPCDLVPAAVSLMLFDFGWNTGCSNSVHILQQALGVVADGDFGPISQRAMNAVTDLPAFDAKLGALQATHYRALRNFTVYGKGWIARTARRQAAALACLTSPTT